MKLSEFINNSRASLEGLYPFEEASAIVSLLTQEVLGVNSYTHITEPNYEIEPKSQEFLNSAIARLLDSEPLQYILGYTEFYSRRFKLNPSVLIPRPETELLVEYAKSLLQPGHKVLDLCTGSGCIAWSLALECPESRVVGVDISAEALDLARTQFTGAKVIGNQPFTSPNFMQFDILSEDIPFECGSIDLIVSNPPYILESEKSAIRSNVLKYEPELALFVKDEDPLIFYLALARWTEHCLKSGGYLIAEINENLGPQTARIFSRILGSSCEILKDLSSKDRFVKIQK